MRFHSLVIIALLFAHLFSAVAVVAITLWPDVNSGKVTKIANFAINEHNKRSNANLTLVSILSCSENVFAVDSSFSLELLAKDGKDTTNKYLAHVFEARFTTDRFQLKAFELTP
ncbi:hypothetical protein PIB30_032855 [Stylosanthes scabra]|uniref:Cystatin domain-containing protein n=1 Tax=Stylosanthes scabra TaxID=79078 RepID=A0ABU6RD64_9FABA|nr:hypothetical protein [Stylosanthes scabra]